MGEIGLLPDSHLTIEKRGFRWLAPFGRWHIHVPIVLLSVAKSL